MNAQIEVASLQQCQIFFRYYCCLMRPGSGIGLDGDLMVDLLASVLVWLTLATGIQCP